MDKQNRLSYLDSIRGWACLLVILCHVASSYSGIVPELFVSWMSLGRFGVQAFYVLSGFLCCRSYYRLNYKYGKMGGVLFYLRRLFRIYPLWILSIILYAVFDQTSPVRFVDIIANLTCLFGLLPNGVITWIIPHGWSVSIEWLFYLLMPFILMSFGERKKLLYAICGLSVAAFLLNAVGVKMCGRWPQVSPDFFYEWLPNQLVAFFVGIYLYYRFEQKSEAESSKFGSGIVLVLLILFLGLSDVLFRSLLWAVLVVVLSKYTVRLLDNRFTRLVGQSSYGIYLIHMIIKHKIQLLIPGTSAAAVLISTVLIFSISALAGILAFYFIEEPMKVLERKIESKLISRSAE